jgi:glycosyltransferase involved in cell wall biosynthesis
VLISVIIPTHNPHAGRLGRTLAALRAQSLPPTQWETILVDNASSPPVDPALFKEMCPRNLRLIQEPQLGLTFARRRGLTAATGQFLVLVDDDNVLNPDYLNHVAQLFSAHPRISALGGRSIPEFEQPPETWVREFDDLLACRDLGSTPLISRGLRDPATGRAEYPAFAPIGAGLALRREAAQTWLADPNAKNLSDRRGHELTSGGDNDIILTLMRHEWEVAYYPELKLTHLIPAGRLTADYLGRLNRSIQKSWMQVLTRHDANPWPPIPGWTVPLRKFKAWFTSRAWSSAAARVRWQGACGHFEGRSSP